MSNESRGWAPDDPALMPGFELWRAGRCEPAAEFFEDAVRRLPLHPCAWRGLGSVRWTQGRFADAERAFRRTLELDGWTAMHWANLGLVCRELGLRTRAINAFAVAIRLDPTYEPAYNEWANVLVDDQRYPEALTLYDRALSVDATRAVVHHNRGVCLRALGRNDDARASFHAALARDPTYRHSIQELDRLGEGGERCRQEAGAAGQETQVAR